MSGLVLRLAAPLQSWGEHSAFGDRDTVRFPTRSGLIGLLACAEGHRRDEPLDRYEPLRFTVRIDRPGTPCRDFHTIGGGYPRHRTVLTAERKRRTVETATIVTKRHYLADAVFCVAVDGPDELTEALAAALRAPRWQPYLGRRSCPASEPLLLRAGIPDAAADLHHQVPLARFPKRGSTEPVGIDFVTETAASDRDANSDTDPDADRGTVIELADVPTSFHRLSRRYRTRAVTITTRPMPAQLCAGRGLPYLNALHTYATKENP